MILKIKELRGRGRRLRDVDAALNAEGFYLPWDAKKVDAFFRYAKKGKNTVIWRDKEGNVVNIIFIMETLKADIYESTMSIYEADYFTIDVVSRSIREFLHDKKK